MLKSIFLNNCCTAARVNVIGASTATTRWNNLIFNKVITSSYHLNIITNKRESSFTSGGGANRTQLTIFEQLRTPSRNDDDDDFEKPKVINKNSRYLDRNEKRHSHHSHDDGSRRRDVRRNRYVGNKKDRFYEDDDPWAEKPKVMRRLPPPEITRNKYITDDLEDHFSNAKPKVKVPSFFANPTNAVQDVVKMKANVTKHITEHKMRRGGNIQHVTKQTTTTTTIEKTAIQKTGTTTTIEKTIDSELNEILDVPDIENLKNSKRFELIDSLENLDDNTLFEKIEEIDLSQIKLSDEENRSRLQTFYFDTLPEYIEECLLNKLKNQDSMTDNEYYAYLGMERLYITSAIISEDYRTITLNYKLLVREGIDEIGEEVFDRDVKTIEQLFHSEFVRPTLETFEKHHGRLMLREFEKPHSIKLCCKGIRKYEPGIFDEPLPEVKPGQRRQHVNPFAELPYFTGEPLSGEKVMNIINNLGINIAADENSSKVVGEKVPETKHKKHRKIIL